MQVITVLQVKPSERTGRDYKHRSRHETAPNPGLALDSALRCWSFLASEKTFCNNFWQTCPRKTSLNRVFMVVVP